MVATSITYVDSLEESCFARVQHERAWAASGSTAVALTYRAPAGIGGTSHYQRWGTPGAQDVGIDIRQARGKTAA